MVFAVVLLVLRLLTLLSKCKMRWNLVTLQSNLFDTPDRIGRDLSVLTFGGVRKEGLTVFPLDVKYFVCCSYLWLNNKIAFVEWVTIK